MSILHPCLSVQFSCFFKMSHNIKFSDRYFLLKCSLAGSNFAPTRKSWPIPLLGRKKILARNVINTWIEPDQIWAPVLVYCRWLPVCPIPRTCPSISFSEHLVYYLLNPKRLREMHFGFRKFLIQYFGLLSNSHFFRT